MTLSLKQRLAQQRILLAPGVYDALSVIVDGDTGFGNALNVERTVRGFERA